MIITLPFPPASLSGHNSGHWRDSSKVVAKYRYDAHRLAEAAMQEHGWVAPPKWEDIPIRFTFVPPDNRGDRTNFPIRIKAGIDGVALGLGVNDKRFLPSYVFLPPAKPGCVIVEIGLPTLLPANG